MSEPLSGAPYFALLERTAERVNKWPDWKKGERSNRMTKPDKIELTEETLTEWYSKSQAWGPDVPVYSRFRMVIDALRATRQEADSRYRAVMDLVPHTSAFHVAISYIKRNQKRIAELEQFIAASKDVHNLEDVKRIAELEQQLAAIKLAMEITTADNGNYYRQSQRDRERIGELNRILQEGLDACPEDDIAIWTEDARAALTKEGRDAKS